MAIVPPATAVAVPRLGSAFGLSDRGRVRGNNEDNFLIDPTLSLLAICDGMGGHHGGEIAAEQTLEEIRNFLMATTQGVPLPGHDAVLYEPDPDATWPDQTMPAIATLWDAVEYANDRLYQRNVNSGTGNLYGMGSTLTGIWRMTDDGPLMCFHVGDSRLYRFRDYELTRITKDHTLYQQALDEGIVDALPNRNLLLQAIGPSPSVRPDIKAVDTTPGDVYLLCTDGLHGLVPEIEIERLLRNICYLSLEEQCNQLIALANDFGGTDNVTAVLIRYDDQANSDKPIVA
ncbi:protein phosphatase 2C domain-containing protein [Chitinivorax sp. B]|uniref:PP2C family protein-serine/threonine phosphatase n=1 Tax=Chitinivorax sp. B TaxID=2502235 RepID=UPI002016D84D|nr:protein phosphatase 2C domain-containing protein [Chitinivorax sp. B]